jgi:hypothetical protein
MFLIHTQSGTSSVVSVMEYPSEVTTSLPSRQSKTLTLLSSLAFCSKVSWTFLRVNHSYTIRVRLLSAPSSPEPGAIRNPEVDEISVIMVGDISVVITIMGFSHLRFKHVGMGCGYRI